MSTSYSNSNQNSDFKSCKIAIIGDGGVGKTTYMKRFLTGEFTKFYIPTIGADLTVLDYNTTKEKIKFIVMEYAGQEKFSTSLNRYHDTFGAIVMFDITNRLSFKSIIQWANDYKQKCPNGLIIFCGNKVDINTKHIPNSEICRVTNLFKDSIFFQISAKSNYNFEKPFLSFARSYFKDDQLNFCNDINKSNIVHKNLEEQTDISSYINQCSQHIKNIDYVLATGNSTIESLKVLLNKTSNLILDYYDYSLVETESKTNMYQENQDKLEKYKFMIMGVIKYLHGTAYSDLEINEFN